jgi:D-glycero-alpha-D-manno-heptose-7-phosphate kinase
MIFVSSPLRVSFFGGGSDIKNYYSKNGGAFLSTGIEYRLYLAINFLNSNKIKLHYQATEILNNIHKVKHPLIKNSLKLMNIKNNIEIASFADFPSHQRGLGSSSAFSVALIGGLHALKNKKISNKNLAKLACYLEINMCQEPIGIQDQYASSFGKLSFYKINKKGEINIENLNLPLDQIKDLEKSLFLVDTSLSRKASLILKKQSKIYEIQSKIKLQRNIVEHAYLGKNFLIKGYNDEFGKLLSETWHLKKKLTKNINNSHLEEIYNLGLRSGAIGGKLLGAGGGGYFLFYVPIKNRKQFLGKFNSNKVKSVKFSKKGFHIYS